MPISNNYFKKFKWKFLCQKLVLENCLVFGQHSQFTSKNITKYLLGTRGTMEIFKLYELRYLLLRIYPLIHTLFYNPRVNLKLAVKTAKLREKQSISTAIKGFTKPKFSKKKTSFIVKHKNLLPQILFATITPAFAGIISQAAKICNMPYHQKRWLNGSITAALSHTFDTNLWSNIEDYTQDENLYFFRKQWGMNKENWTKSKEKARYFNHSRWPSLIIIPDITNNTMILSEIKKIGLPVIGLVNSHCHFEIEYPIFAQDQNFSSVHFFCYFLATLVAKETVYTQHKRYTKSRSLRVKQSHLPRIKQQKSPTVSFRKLLTQQTIKEYWKKPFFFKCLSPAKEKFSNRYTLLQQIFSYPYQSYYVIQKIKKDFKKSKKKKTRNDYTVLRWWEAMCGGKDNRWHNGFIRLMRFIKYVPLGVWTAANFKNIWQLNKQSREQNVTPTRNFFKKEEKKKYLFRKSHNFLLSFEKNYLINDLFRNFLWINKKIHMFWKYKSSVSNRKILLPNSYYWWTLKHFASESKWGGHKYILPKILQAYQWEERTKKQFWYDHYKKYKTFYKKKLRQNKKTKLSNDSWKTWIKKTKKPYLKNKNVQKI